MKIILKNYDCPLGEIDLIGRKDNRLLFCSKNVSTSTIHAISYYLKRYAIKNMAITVKEIK